MLSKTTEVSVTDDDHFNLMQWQCNKKMKIEVHQPKVHQKCWLHGLLLNKFVHFKTSSYEKHRFMTPLKNHSRVFWQITSNWFEKCLTPNCEKAQTQSGENKLRLEALSPSSHSSPLSPSSTTLSPSSITLSPSSKTLSPYSTALVSLCSFKHLHVNHQI